MKKRQECIDAGSEYCPCYLAETYNCLTCSRLQGKEFCDCNWRGICIYQEYLTNGNKIKEQRDYYKSKINEIKKIGKDAYMMKLKVTKKLARELKEPGAYVFLRDERLPQYFDVPMSIMQSDDFSGEITIAFKVVGAKTISLMESKDDVLVKGPYWNGVYGLSNIENMKNKRCLVVARGISQAPALPIIEKLIRNKNKVFLILDKGSIGETFIKKFIKDIDIDIYEEDVMSDKGIHLIKDILTNKEINLIFSAGSDLLHNKIISMIDELKIEPFIAITNNNEICCGEGICGACILRLKEGTKVKTCKVQIDSRKIIERRVFVG